MSRASASHPIKKMSPRGKGHGSYGAHHLLDESFGHREQLYSLVGHDLTGGSATLRIKPKPTPSTGKAKDAW
jgi:hypothetical protein